MKNRYDLFGSLPDTIKDEWIDDIETLGERLDEYINAQENATGFDGRKKNRHQRGWRCLSGCLLFITGGISISWPGRIPCNPWPRPRHTHCGRF